MSDPAELMCELARNGESAAASELVHQFYQRIFAYFRRLCGNEEDSADLTQRTFSKAWTSLRSYQGRSSFSTWLHGIAHHVYVDWRRKPNRNDPQTDQWWECRVAEGPSPADDVAERELTHQLYFWVDRLQEDQKQAVHLHYYQGLSLSETSEVLGIPTSTLKYRLRGALDFLRAKTAEPVRH